MGKAQSKRSIDITTDPKKVGEGNEVAGKVEKIEDADQAAAPALNGDAATSPEKSEDATATSSEVCFLLCVTVEMIKQLNWYFNCRKRKLKRTRKMTKI